MRRYRPVLVLAILLLAAGSQQSQSAKPKPADAGVTDEEYAIYSVLIDNAKSIFTTGCLRKDYQVVVIRDRTSTGYGEMGARDYENLLKVLPGLSRESVAEFVARNKQPQPLRNRFTAKVKCMLISDKEVHSIFDKAGRWWPEFYRRYPKSQGILTLSRVGFNRTKDQALVYAGDQSDGLAGAGYCVLLAKKKGTWSIRSKVMLWIS